MSKIKAKQFLSPCEHGKMRVNTFGMQNYSESIEEDSVALNEIPRRKDCQLLICSRKKFSLILIG